MEQIIKSCRYLLNHCPDAEETLKYVEERVNKDSQEKFLFGYFPPLEKNKLLSDLVGTEELIASGLLVNKSSSEVNRNKYYSFFQNYPMILPYRNVYGDIIAIVGRSILSEKERKQNNIAKYKNTSFNKGNHLFGLYESKKSILDSGFAYVVEGQFDVIKAHQRGLHNIVALGNSNMTPYQAALISRYTDTIFLLLDNDEAGEKGRERITNKYGEHLNIQNIRLPEGYKDIDEYFEHNDLDSLNFIY